VGSDTHVVKIVTETVTLLELIKFQELLKELVIADEGELGHLNHEVAQHIKMRRDVD